MELFLVKNSQFCCDFDVFDDFDACNYKSMLA
jgi:hypothetical protein